MRRNIYLPEPDYRALLHLKAIEEARTGATVSVSEMIRLLIERASA